MTPVLNLESVGVRRHGRVILSDITMMCERGSVTALRGPNGAGKSTLLGVATGLVASTWGSVHKGSARTSYLPERFTPPSGLDVTTYLRWVASTRGVPRRARDEAISLSLFSLGFVGPRGPMRLLSKGNLQRVGLASALLGAPEFIVLDEPFTGMDREGTELVAQAIDAARRNGSALLVVHHGAASFSATQSFWLESGTLHGVRPRADRYTIYAATNGSLPRLSENTTVVPVSAGRVAVSTDPTTLERTLDAILGAGWTVRGVERR